MADEVEHAARVAAPLIPRKAIFGNPDKTMARLSHDGAWLSYLAPLAGVLNVWVAPAATPAAARPVTHDTGRGIRFYAWAYNNRHLLYIQDQNGDENWRVYRTDVGGGEAIDLTPLSGVQAQIQQISPEFPDEILVALNDRLPQLHDVWKINVETGERTLVLQNEAGFAAFATDDHFAVRLGQQLTASGGLDLLKPDALGGWQPFISLPPEDVLATQPVGFDKSGNILYASDSRNRDTGALVAIDMRTGESSLLAQDARADVGGVMLHPTEKHPQAVAFNYEREDWRVLDAAIAADLAYLRTVAPGDLEVVDRTLDDRYWIAVYLSDSSPARYYLYARDPAGAAPRGRPGTVQFLFEDRPALAGRPLARMYPVVVTARDGLKLVCYYSLPPGSDPDGDGRPDRPLPMVLLVHGGPWGRDSWGFSPWHQWLANRGYAVLSVNYRASVGFGKAFANAGNFEWGGKIHYDLLDAVAWAVQNGIADDKRVAIMGGSFGGYATLVGLTFTPEAFACGVDIVGPSNLVTLFESIPPYWQPQMELFTTRVGDHRTAEGRAHLKKRSPLTYAGRIRRPLLIGQGANDVRVKQAEAEQIVAAMQKHGLAVTYVVYPDEGHGFGRPENSLSFNAIAEAFLARCLGGRYEPVGDDFRGASLTVPVGAEQIPGLTEALGVEG